MEIFYAASAWLDLDTWELGKTQKPFFKLPQIAGVRAAWDWLVTDLVTDEVLFGEPALCKLLKVDGLRSLAKAPLKTQRILSHEVAATAFARLQAPSSSLSQSDRVRLSSCAGYGAHAWLKAITSTRLFKLNNNEARTSVLFMLHLPHPLFVCTLPHTTHVPHHGGWPPITSLRRLW